jgi:hypothetical protein
MPLPKRLQQAVKKLSPQQLQALQALLDQLIRQTSPQASPEPYAFASQRLAKMNVKRSLSRRSLGLTYRREYVKCGKKGCSCAKGKGHGPYWYAYWREGKKLKKKYLGKKRTGGG